MASLLENDVADTEMPDPGFSTRGSDPADLAVGHIISHYEITGKLGQGGMGAVYKAVDTTLGRTLALKVILGADISADDKLRFAREAKAASALNHPNIVTIYEYNSANGTDFIAMEYVEGAPLNTLMAAAPLPLPALLDYSRQTASALVKAHGAGIIHRDLKPGNIIVSRDGAVKVLDFGLAKRSSDQGAADLTTALTRAGVAMGTPAYMSPEQAMGRPVDHRSDIFSFGVILYEMACGRRPFHAENELAITWQIAFAEAVPPQTANPGLPAALCVLIEGCLQKETAARPGSMKDVLVALSSITAGTPTGAFAAPVLFRESAETKVPDIAFPGSGQSGRRTRVIRALAGMILLAGLSAVTWRESARWNHPRRQIAILPLATGGETSLQQLADGVSTVMADSLAEAHPNSGPRVSSAAELQNARVTDVTSARRKLGSDAVISGEIRREGGNLRTSLNLIETSNQKIASSVMVVAPADDVALFESRVRAAAARLLGVSDATRQDSLQLLRTESPEAFQDYVRAAGLLTRSYDNKNVDLAIAALQPALALVPASAPVLVGLCEAYELKFEKTKDGKWLDAAEAPCRRAPEADPGFAPGLVRRGALRAARGDPQHAMEDFERALVLDPGSEPAALLLASTNEALGLPDKAEAALKRFVDSHPASWNGYRQLGLYYFRHDRFDAAVREFQQVIRLTPDSATAYGNLALTLSSWEHLPEAEKAFQRALHLGPTFAIYSNLGNMYLREERYAEAGAAYEKALEINPEQHRIWGNLAAAYSRMPGQQGQTTDAYRRAADLCRVAIKANPNDAPTLADLASYEAFTGERAEPLATIQQALALAPKDSGVLYNAAETYEWLGFREQALLWLGKLLDLGYPLKDIERSTPLASLRKDSRYKALTAGRK